ncbi:MAG: hypothetical protein PHF20_01980 [Halothiobacillaceae bacterium]|nr:hypothetical protein [Halothiobacillaceae bacterium]
MNTSLDANTQHIINKVPEITLWFWIIKILATTVGETGADFLNMTLGFGLTNTSIVMAGLFLAALVVQIRSKQLNQPLYWLVVVIVSVVGTLVTDNLVDNMGVTLQVLTPVFFIALLITFGVWYAREKTLSMHHIDSLSREGWYWLAILLTFALGTAAGDLAAETMKLGYLPSTLMFASAIAIIALLHYTFKLGAIAAFWMAYVLTRPLGASFGDWLSQAIPDGGLGWGTVATSLTFLATILLLVTYLALRGNPLKTKN